MRFKTNKHSLFFVLWNSKAFISQNLEKYEEIVCYLSIPRWD